MFISCLAIDIIHIKLLSGLEKALCELAQQAEKIGTLNIIPDLLETLLKENNKRTQKP